MGTHRIGQTAVQAAAQLLGRRAMSERMLVKKLVEKGFDEQEAVRAAERMKELSFVNDAEYADMLVRHYTAKGYGVLRIRQELKIRLVAESACAHALASLADNADNGAESILRAKLKNVDLSDKKALSRAVNAVMRRGFTWDQISPALARITNQALDE